MAVEGETAATETVAAASTTAAADTTLVTAPAAEAATAAEVKPATEALVKTDAEIAAEAEAAAKAEAEKGKKPDQHTTLGAPEAYEFKAPEGVELDGEMISALSETAKELDLSQAAAEKFVGLGLKLQERWETALGEQVLAERQGWLEATQADKDIGGDKLPETLATAKRALEAYGDANFTKLLDETGLGNNPSMIRLLANAGKSVSEDGFVGGRAPANSPNATLAERLYPSAKKES